VWIHRPTWLGEKSLVSLPVYRLSQSR
jgi:hypothetical protein